MVETLVEFEVAEMAVEVLGCLHRNPGHEDPWRVQLFDSFQHVLVGD